MAEHTPGPWQLGDDYEGRPSVDVCNSLGEGIATAWYGTRIYHRMDHGNPELEDVSREQAHADARLMAAAPDLLAASEAVLHEWQEGTDPKTLRRLMGDVYCAIKKARGS